MSHTQVRTQGVCCLVLSTWNHILKTYTRGERFHWPREMSCTLTPSNSLVKPFRLSKLRVLEGQANTKVVVFPAAPNFKHGRPNSSERHTDARYRNQTVCIGIASSLSPLELSQRSAHITYARKKREHCAISQSVYVCRVVNCILKKQRKYTTLLPHSYFFFTF